MVTNTCVSLSVVILIVMKWIVVHVLGINFAGTNFAYLPVLSKVFPFHMSMLLLPRKSSPCLFTDVQLFGSAGSDASLVVKIVNQNTFI